MKDLLQGKPFRHPLHPVLVHFPIAFFILSLVLDLASFVFPEVSGLVRAAFYALLIGVGTAVLAAIAGAADYVDIRQDHPARKVATTHMVLNLIAVGVFAASVGLRYADQSQAQTPVVALLLSLGGMGLIAVSGHLGGKLVYDNGIGVGRHRRRTSTPRATLSVAVDPAKQRDGLVPVLSATALQEGETARISLDGQVLALVKLDGEFYAFQDFCPHRYGPLSEGAFHHGQVECPWHRSCFDVKTGAVTQGPAKVPLKTFKVTVQEGQIFIDPKGVIEPSPDPAA